MHLKLFANCITVKGALRSSICDLQRHDVHLIPNSLYEVLTLCDGNSIKEIKQIYNNKYNEVIDSYINFLTQKELIFFTKEPDRFPDINLRWLSPYTITNAILDFNNETNIYAENIFLQLESMECKHIQLRFFNIPSLSYIETLLSKLISIDILSVEVLLRIEGVAEENILIKMVEQYPKNKTLIMNFIVHSYRENKVITMPTHPKHPRTLIFIKDKITSSNHCGFISASYFSVNINTFTEAQKHNTCLNRKISIDVDGNIKNCPSMTKSYGNIKDTTLQEAIEKPGFKDVWYIHKDQIKVCQDCEFRYICTDCRAFIENPEDIYSKPAKCHYDPYTATWAEVPEESQTNPLHGT